MTWKRIQLLVNCICKVRTRRYFASSRRISAWTDRSPFVVGSTCSTCFGVHAARARMGSLAQKIESKYFQYGPRVWRNKESIILHYLGKEWKKCVVSESVRVCTGLYGSLQTRAPTNQLSNTDARIRTAHDKLNILEKHQHQQKLGFFSTIKLQCHILHFAKLHLPKKQNSGCDNLYKT